MQLATKVCGTTLELWQKDPCTDWGECFHYITLAALHSPLWYTNPTIFPYCNVEKMCFPTHGSSSQTHLGLMIFLKAKIRLIGLPPDGKVGKSIHVHACMDVDGLQWHACMPFWQNFEWHEWLVLVTGKPSTSPYVQMDTDVGNVTQALGPTAQITLLCVYTIRTRIFVKWPRFTDI